jgi:NAD(P)-dependent dehydrogenase (short-subunit alcohol dehydrogenase family)
MSSGTANQGRIRFDDLQSEHRYKPHSSYAQSKLADLLLTLRLAEISTERGWNLLSTGAHPGYTRTNLMTTGPTMGGSNRSLVQKLFALPILPSQDAEHGTEPLLYAAADPAARNGEYYGPTGRFGLVGPTGKVSIPRPARNSAVAKRLWSEAERLTGTQLPN